MRDRRFAAVGFALAVHAAAGVACGSAALPVTPEDAIDGGTGRADAGADAGVADSCAAGEDAGVDPTNPIACAPAYDAGCDDGGSCSGACHAVDAGAAVDELAVARAAPPACGGRIRQGHYRLASAKTYTGPGGFSGPTGRRVLGAAVVCGDQLQLAFSTASSGPFTVSGHELTFAPTCPHDLADASYGYTASATRLLLYGTFRSGFFDEYELVRE